MNLTEPRELISTEDLKDMFYSGFPGAVSWQVLDDLFVAIHTGALAYKKVTIAAVETYHRIQDTIVVAEGLGPQGKGHMALKEVATRWLWQRYHVEAVCEAYFVGLHPDVCSKDYGFVIECGTTDPSCVRIFLGDPRVVWVGNIPYPFVEESNLTLHIFSRGPNYQMWQQEKVNAARNAFEKFHRK